MGNSSKKATISIIFLDVDGVLNCKETNGNIDDDKLLLLKQIIDETVDTKIVISSSWRINKLNVLSQRLNEYGIKYFDITPQIQKYKKAEQNRIIEIESQLSIMRKTYDIKNWIAIDDYNLLKFNSKLFKGHFVHTSVFHGIRKKDVVEAIELLSF